MKTLCIIPCGSKKIWNINPTAGPTKAKDVYKGAFANKCRQYAETFYQNSWCILSAKYGFLFPDDVVPGPYNVTFNNIATGPITEIELKVQARKRRLNRYSHIVVLAGNNYVKMIKQVFSDKQIVAPLEGCKGMGYMMSWMNDVIISTKKIA